MPGEMVADIEAAVAAGEFTDTSEVVRDALRQWRRSRSGVALDSEDLRRLVSGGRENGVPVDGECALKGLRTKYAALSLENYR